jgi:hypothetical protein
MNQQNRNPQVGIDRIIRLQWLEQISLLATAENSREAMKERVEEFLSKTYPASNPRVRGSLSKTATILLNVWAPRARDLAGIRKRGLELIRYKSLEERIAMHWTMMNAVYPFWGAVAAQVGRLIRLQGVAVAEQVQRRVRESYGERETVSRRVRYILRSFIDWGVLTDTDVKGTYRQGLVVTIEDPKLISLIIESSLIGRPNRSASLTELINSAEFFPFRMKGITPEAIRAVSPRLEIHRNVMDGDLVILTEIPTID